MWAQSWLNLLDICEPYDGKPTIDITPALQEQVNSRKTKLAKRYKINYEPFLAEMKWVLSL